MTARIIQLHPRVEPARAFELIVTLAGITPPIWRRLRVASDFTLRDLHHVLQIAFGWNDSHLHEFEIAEKRYGFPDPDVRGPGRQPLDERKSRLGKLVAPGDRFEYLYDFGDEWRHEIAVADLAPSARGAKAKVLDGARAGPPDDAGGPLRYMELLAILRKPKHKEYRAVRGWLGPDFSPEELDAQSTNFALRGAGSAAFRRKREWHYRDAD